MKAPQIGEGDSLLNVIEPARFHHDNTEFVLDKEDIFVPETPHFVNAVFDATHFIICIFRDELDFGRSAPGIRYPYFCVSLFFPDLPKSVDINTANSP